MIFDSNQELLEQFSEGSDPFLNNSAEVYRLSIEIAGFKARLCQLIHGMIGLYGGSAGPVTLDAILTYSKDYVRLSEQTPQILRQPDKPQFGLGIRGAQ